MELVIYCYIRDGSRRSRSIKSGKFGLLAPQASFFREIA
jgi:hypothetical protein